MEQPQFAQGRAGALLIGRNQRNSTPEGGLLSAISAPALSSVRSTSKGPSASPVLGQCSFATRSSPLASRQLLSRKAQQQSVGRAMPFASLSFAPFAALTVAPKTVTDSGTPVTVTVVQKKKSPSEILQVAGKKALQGGLPGMAAMALQVLSLMWLRTTINYQYRYGTSTMTALTTLWSQGGIPRFYSGLAPALIQGPLSRFGDTAANTGALALMEDVDIPMPLKTVIASLSAGIFRIALMPVDALKTIMQVEGAGGIAVLANKVKVGGPGVLYHGAIAASAATFVGHYPWFAMYNWLNESLPKYDELKPRLLRSAFIGFCSSFVSDCCSNSIRVLKTAKQTSTVPVTYLQITQLVIEKEGVLGLFGRGLGTKLITNGIQGILFSVLWRLGQDYMIQEEKKKKAALAVAEEAVAAVELAAASGSVKDKKRK